MGKKSIIIVFLLLVLLPQAAMAAADGEKTVFHVFYEKTFGPLGAVAGIMAMVALWQAAKKTEDKHLIFVLKMFTLVLAFINIGSISFGLHGSGALSGEASRYIERVCRLIALLAADIAALTFFLRISRKEKPSAEK